MIHLCQFQNEEHTFSLQKDHFLIFTLQDSVKDTRKILGTSSLFISKKIGERGSGWNSNIERCLPFIQSFMCLRQVSSPLTGTIEVFDLWFFSSKEPTWSLDSLEARFAEIFNFEDHSAYYQNTRKLEQNNQLLLQLHTYVLFFEEISVPLKGAKKIISATIKTF